MSLSSIFERVSSQIATTALSKVRIPTKVQQHLPLARKLIRGDIDGAINVGLDMVGEKFGVPGFGSRYPGPSMGLFTPSALLGGITMKEARAIFEECVATDYAKKNLWHIAITNLSGGEPYNFNLFATDVGYAPSTVSGDAVLIGSGSFDNITGTERVEMRVTTLDDSEGSIKRWFKDRYDRVARPDGTFGLPVEYVFKVEVMHAFISERAEGSGAAFIDTFLMRPTSIEYEKSRRDDNLEELQMTFTQFDTFSALT